MYLQIKSVYKPKRYEGKTQKNVKKSACHLIRAVTDEKLTIGNATLKTAAGYQILLCKVARTDDSVHWKLSA